MRAARRKGGSVMSRKCIGIDIGGTTVKLGMFEQDGTLLEKWEIPTRKENGGAHILEDIAAAIKKKAAERGLSTADFEGAGMGLPNMKKYTDTMQIESTVGVGTTVRMTVLL